MLEAYGLSKLTWNACDERFTDILAASSGSTAASAAHARGAVPWGALSVEAGIATYDRVVTVRVKLPGGQGRVDNQV